MTSAGDAGRNEALVRKRVRARGLTDPLGAKGHRQTSGRVAREAGARRLLFVGALASFAATFGVLTFGKGGGVAEVPPASTPSAQVIAEIPVPGGIDGEQVILRVVAPAPEVHVRTKATP